MTDGVDPSMDSVQPSNHQSVANRPPAETKFDELAPGDCAVLPRRERRDHPVMWSTYCTVLVP